MLVILVVALAVIPLGLWLGLRRSNKREQEELETGPFERFQRSNPLAGPFAGLPPKKRAGTTYSSPTSPPAVFDEAALQMMRLQEQMQANTSQEPQSHPIVTHRTPDWHGDPVSNEPTSVMSHETSHASHHSSLAPDTSTSSFDSTPSHHDSGSGSGGDFGGGHGH